MTNRLIDPLMHIIERWRTARATVHLDDHLREDAGIRVEPNPWDNLNMARRGYWTGRTRK